MKKWYIIASFFALFSVAGFAYAATGQPDFSQVSEISTTGGFQQLLGTSTDTTYNGTISSLTAFLISCDGNGTDSTLVIYDDTAVTHTSTYVLSHSFASGTAYSETWNFPPYVFTPGHAYHFTMGVLSSSCVKTLGAADPISWPYGIAKNNDTGLEPTPVVDLYFTSNFNMTGFTAPSTSTIVQLAWPPDGSTVNRLYWWPVNIASPIPFASSVDRQNIVVRYSITPPGSSTIYEADTLFKWNGGLDSNGIVWIEGNQARHTIPDGTVISAQAAYVIQYNDLRPQQEYDSNITTFTVDKGAALSTSSIGGIAQSGPNPNPYSTSTSPFKKTGPLFTIYPCGAYTVPLLGTFENPFCLTSNWVKLFLNSMDDSITTAYTNLRDGLLQVFPINIYNHLLTDFKQPAMCAYTTGEIDVHIGSAPNIAVFSSSSFNAKMSAAGAGNYRDIVDFILYALTGGVILIWSIMAFAWATNHKEQ